MQLQLYVEKKNCYSNKKKMEFVSYEDRCKLVIASGSDKSHTQLCHEFNQNHPDIIIRPYDIANLLKRFFKNGSIKTKNERKQEFTTDSEFCQNEVDQVYNVINEDPHTSITRSSLITGISRSKTHKILKEGGFHPYKLQYLQTLETTDFQKRLDMCNWFQNKIHTIPNFIRHVSVVSLTRLVFH